MAKDVLEKDQNADIDETLYSIRRIQGGMNVILSVDEKISEFGYHELLQFAWMCCSQLEAFSKDLDEIIKELITAGAKDYKIPA